MKVPGSALCEMYECLRPFEDSERERFLEMVLVLKSDTWTPREEFTPSVLRPRRPSQFLAEYPLEVCTLPTAASHKSQ